VKDDITVIDRLENNLKYCCFLLKNSKVGAARCQTFRLKCIKSDLRWGCATDPAGRVYNTPPDFLAAFKGPTSNEMAGEEGKIHISGYANVAKTC